MSEIDSIKKILREQKIAHWDIYVEEAEQYEIQLRNFDVETERGPVKNSGYSVRIIKPKNKKIGIGIGTGNILQPEHIRRCLNTASIGASITEFPGYIMPKPKAFPTVKIADHKIMSDAESVVKDRVEQLLSLLKRSKTVLPTFGKIRVYTVSTSINNSEGVQAEKKETLLYIELALKAEREGKLAEYWPTRTVRRTEDLQLEQQIPKWTKLAEDTLNAKPPKTMKTSVIFAPDTLGNLLPDTVGFHCLGSTVFKGVSKFNKGDQVGSSDLTIYDDGLYDYALGSSPFDDEGTPQSRTVLIEKGLHKNFLYDAMYGTVLKAESTGNGQKMRQIDLKYSALPSLQPSNIVVKPGNMNLDEMLETTKEGIYVERFSAAQSDPLTTSFGSEIRNAYLIEKGELSTPLKGGQISGFLLGSQETEGEKTVGLINRISGITREFQLAHRCITPYIRFESVQVSGK
jgi:predicted Zn-dependent protease